MYVLNNFLYGFSISAIGIALPGLINMTSVKIAMERNLRSGLLFSAGSTVTIFFQALIAVTFAGYLAEHLEVLSSIKKIGVFILLVLSMFFFYKALRPKLKEGSERKGYAFMIGLAVAALNVLNIPFYFTMTTFLEAEALINLEPFSGFFFIMGISFGGFCLLAIYAYFAGLITRRATYFARNMNYFLSGLFLLLAVFQWMQLYFDYT